MPMKTIAYSRISTDKQDLEKQKHLINEYAVNNKMIIDEFIEVEASSKKGSKQRKIDELLEKLNTGDTLLVAELSRLGRNMLETLNIINTLSEKGIKIIFIRQPELSTTAHHAKLLFAIYSYFAESEREFISIRTKQGLKAAKEKGKMLGRPKGSKNNKPRVLDPYNDEIKTYLEMGLAMRSIWKIVSSHMDAEISYNSFKYYIDHDKSLEKSRKIGKEKEKLKHQFIKEHDERMRIHFLKETVSENWEIGRKILKMKGVKEFS